MMTDKERLWNTDKAEFNRRYIRQEYGPEQKPERIAQRRITNLPFAPAENAVRPDRLGDLLKAVELAPVYNAGAAGASLVARLKSLKEGAATRELEFSITDQEALALIAAPCNYCGLLEKHHYNGIDRVDNDLGYVAGNVVACCRWCNYAKGRRRVADFRAWLQWVANSPIVNPVQVAPRVLRTHNVVIGGRVQERRRKRR